MMYARCLPLAAVIAVSVAIAVAGGATAIARPQGSEGLPTSTVSPRHVQPQPRAGSCHARGTGELSLPDPHCTPGAIDPVVTQSDLGRTICRSGYSESVRPSESVTEAEKRASLRSYGDRRPLGDYEYDHLVSLELGGALNDPRNLWPEPGGSPNPKDALEDHLHALVCDGRMTLATAQLMLARDWVTAYRRYRG